MAARLTPISRRRLIKRLRRLGWDGPHTRSSHDYMAKGEQTLTIPNPHRREIGVDLLSKILQQSGISREDWTKSK